ncbi:MAG: VPLPA-CTERM sorting domain-containing protein [Pseudomonadota bacterium]
MSVSLGNVVDSYTIDASNDSEFATFAANAFDPTVTSVTFGLQGLTTSEGAAFGTAFAPLEAGTTLTSVVLEIARYDRQSTLFSDGVNGRVSYRFRGIVKLFGEGPGGSTPVPEDPAPVPLPAGAVLLLTGLAGLAVARRKRAV